MAADTLVRLTYWGGWACAGVALLYRLLISRGVIDGLTALDWGVSPYHLWQLSFLLFLICIASDAMRRKSA